MSSCPVNSHLLPRHYRDINANLKSLIKPKKLCRPLTGLGSGGWVTTGCVVFSVFTAICVWCLSVITKYINFLLTASCSNQNKNLITQNTLTQPSSWPFCDHLFQTHMTQNWEYYHLNVRKVTFVFEIPEWMLHVCPGAVCMWCNPAHWIALPLVDITLAPPRELNTIILLFCSSAASSSISQPQHPHSSKLSSSASCWVSPSILQLWHQCASIFALLA